MPYQTPATFADTNILTASQLNVLSDDIEYLYGLISSTNVPFNSLRTTVNLRANNNQWLLTHRLQYLHYKSRGITGDNDDFYILITIGSQDYCVHFDNTPLTAGGDEGYVDLEDITSWSSYQGAWVTATQYRQYQIVLESGTYYQANTTHTSGATFAGDAANWDSLGSDASPFVVGTRYPMWVYTNSNGAYEFVVDYLLEIDQVTL